MWDFPITYHEPLFRPPSEAKSFILQITLGCSWNKCSFCEMYTSKSFKPRNQEDIFEDIHKMANRFPRIRRVFLADGDPLVLSNKRLVPILQEIKKAFTHLNRISTYASPQNLNNKSFEELQELKNNGLDMLYVGIESGDDETLEAIQKGETFESIEKGLLKGKEIGFKESVMIINGVGGKKFSRQHAIKSAEILNKVQPTYASTLVLTIHKGKEHFLQRFKGEFIELNQLELFQEMRLFMETLDLKETIFRSDHASNFLVLKGVLGKDKTKFLDQIDFAINHPSLANLRPDHLRAL